MVPNAILKRNNDAREYFCEVMQRREAGEIQVSVVQVFVLRGVIEQCGEINEKGRCKYTNFAGG